MVIFINPYAGGGTAFEKWKKIESILFKDVYSVHVITLNEETSMKEYMSDLLQQGHQEFIAGGGDGTVNLLLQYIIELVPSSHLKKIKIGAIGLGSSNDFHKPFHTNQMINGIPCKFNFAFAEARDVGILSFIDNNDHIQQKYWLINTSIGITAEANLFFNTPDLILTYLKKNRTKDAILYAALRTIALYRNRNITIKIGKHKSNGINLTNMGIVKSPHFSGNFSYNTPFKTDNGQFYIHICRDMHLLNTLNLLWNVSKNRFHGLPKTEFFCSDRLTATSDQPFAVEFDGEVAATRNAIFTIKRKMIRVCTC
jgi:diacylglycerol kinase family enzyme